MTDEEKARALWDAKCDIVADRMKVFTRPYVNILAGGVPGEYTDLGTGTFIEREAVEIITCEHVSRLQPSIYFMDDEGSIQLEPGPWQADASENKDVAIAPVPADEWSKVSARAQPLPMSKFAAKHEAKEMELLFFRGIAGENVSYIGEFGVDAIISGYCSQEKIGTGNDQIFEMLWNPKEVKITTGTSEEVRDKVKYAIPAGFSGSLVWNTRFLELGADFEKWSPHEARVTGLLRRFDPKTKTLLVWKIEHVHAWLQGLT